MPHSSTIRPVTRKFPDSKELWDDMNLPMCVVISPVASNDAAQVSRKNLCDLPRCLSCGAPHMTQETHFRPVNEPILLCYLCGKTSSTLLEDQQKRRPLEVLDAATYDEGASSAPPATGEWIVDVPTVGGPLPAMACPPVWWIILDASVSPENKSYWKAMEESLMESLKDIPIYVHVGLLALSSTMMCHVWDLTSRVPHVQTYSLDAPHIPLLPVPADANHLPCIQTAIKAATQNGGGAVGGVGGMIQEGEEEESPVSLGMPLTVGIELVLEHMQTAWHPGKEESDKKLQEDVPLKYAGGKISCFLSQPPMEIDTKPDAPNSGTIGPGGVAGHCAARTVDLWEKAEELPEKEPTDWTPSNLAKYYNPLDPEDILQSLGKQCAEASLGVDLFMVLSSDDTKKEDGHYGLPLLSILSHSSGTPGPLLFNANDETSIHAMKDQLLARVPWSDGLVYGAQLRSRITKGFDLEDAPIKKVGRNKLQLAPMFLTSGGLSGPAVKTQKGLWTMGTCDAHTSVLVDYQILGRPNMLVKGGWTGKIALKPVLQTCVAYTCIEKDVKDGEYYTFRKMKISSLPLPMEKDSEPLYDVIDPEALALTLYHKLLLDAVLDGFVAAQETAETWLKALLVSVYQSAQVEQAKLEEMTVLKKGSEDTEERESLMNASERLLDIEGGELSDEDVLLGQGHPKIAVIPLIVYSLLQCDALRPTMGAFAPSMDARAAALVQMTCMNPSNLSKCIAPSLQLWSSGQDKILADSIDLNQEALNVTLKKLNAPDAVFFLDSPQQILVYRADQGKGGRSTLNLGGRFKAAIQVAAKAYRTPPMIRYQLEAKPFSHAAAMAFDNFLLEDNPTYGGKADYQDWKKAIADEVRA